MAENCKVDDCQQRELRDEIERLTERCAAYKGQVECGAIEIERLRAALKTIGEQALDAMLHKTSKEAAIGSIYEIANQQLGENIK